MTLSQSLRAFSPMRDLYRLQSAMTVSGRVPSMAEVREQFDDFFARPGDLSPRRKVSPTVAGAGIPNNQSAGVAGGDPFAQVEPQPIALYRDGQEYVCDQMQDGRFAATD